MRTTLRSVDSRTLHTWDGIVLFWVALWAVLGVWTGVTLWQAADTGDTISNSGRALTSVGETLVDLSELPLVPDRPGEIGDEVVTTSEEITRRGQEIKGDLRRLGLLLGAAVVGIPVTPVAGLYLPMRILRRREVRSLRREVERLGDHPELDRYLADQARLSLSSTDVLRALSPDGGAGSSGASDAGDEQQRTRALADAELARLGLTRATRA